MAPRRRAQQNDNARPAAPAGAGGERRPRHAASEDDDEDTAPTFNLISACMQFQIDTDSKNKAKSVKALVEAKKIAAEYAEKIQNVILQEQQDVQAVYDEYRAQSKKDIQEKDKILQTLLKNFEDIERLSKTLQERSVFFEDNRYKKTESYLNTAEKKRAGSAEQVAEALAAKRKAVHERTGSTIASNMAKL